MGQNFLSPVMLGILLYFVQILYSFRKTYLSFFLFHERNRINYRVNGGTGLVSDFGSTNEGVELYHKLLVPDSVRYQK